MKVLKGACYADVLYAVRVASRRAAQIVPEVWTSPRSIAPLKQDRESPGEGRHGHGRVIRTTWRRRIQAIVGMADSWLSVVQGSSALILDRSQVTGAKAKGIAFAKMILPRP